MTEISFSKGQPTTESTRQISNFFTQHGRAPRMSVPVETPEIPGFKNCSKWINILLSEGSQGSVFHKRKKNLFFLRRIHQRE